MFISGLNRFFARHGRIIFAIFTGAIIISFVLYFAPGFGFFDMIGNKGGAVDTSAVILGKKVSDKDIDNSVNSMSIMMSLSNPGFNIRNSYMRDQAAQMSLQRIMYLRAAAERNIYVGDAAVAEFLRSAPLFQKNGKFDSGMFDMFVKQCLAPYRYSKMDLDRAVREQLTIERLFNEIKAGVLVTPGELKQSFDLRNEKFKIRTWKFAGDDFAAKVQGSDKDIESFFTANAEKYVIPAKFKIKLVRFNYVSYDGKVTVTDEAIKKYYEAKKDEFKEKDAVLPLEKVADRIKKTLSENEIKAVAMKDAQTFAVEAYQATSELKNHKSMVDGFTAFTEKKGLKTYDIGFFSVEDTVIKNVGREPELATAVAALFMDQPVSDAIQGANACFVACLTEKEEPRPAKLEEVKEKVAKDFKKENSIKLARESARNAALKVSEAMDAGKAIPEIPDCKKEDVPEFSMMAPPNSMDAMFFASLAEETKAGKVSAPKDTPDGSIFICVEKRTLPADQEFKDKEKEFSREYASMKARAAMSMFESSLMARCKFPAPEKNEGKQQDRQ